jgi:hypothetical protein
MGEVEFVCAWMRCKRGKQRLVECSLLLWAGCVGWGGRGVVLLLRREVGGYRFYRMSRASTVSLACAAVLDATACVPAGSLAHVLALRLTPAVLDSMGSRLLSWVRSSKDLLFLIMFMGNTAHLSTHKSTTLLWRHFE